MGDVYGGTSKTETAMMNRLKYPQIECDEHGTCKSSYIICAHVREFGRNLIGHFEKATDKQAGVICCAPCHQNNLQDEFFLLCDKCAADADLIIPIQ